MVASHLLDDAPLNQAANQFLNVMFRQSDVLSNTLIGSKTAIRPPADVPGE
jgi:hypothetical protein